MAIVPAYILSLVCCCAVVIASEGDRDQDVALELRLLVSGERVAFLRRLTNNTTNQVQVVDSYDNNYNGFGIGPLSYRDRPLGTAVQLGEHLRTGPRFNPILLTVPPKSTHISLVDVHLLVPDVMMAMAASDMVNSSFSAFFWILRPWHRRNDRLVSNDVPLAVCRDLNALIFPSVNASDPSVMLILSFIYSQEGDREIGFLCLNGSGEDIDFGDHLFENSRLIIRSAAVDGEFEVILAEPVVNGGIVAAGQVDQWRFSWQTVLGQIPEVPMERIKAAGGDLDLVWKVGDLESQPLPLTLLMPEVVPEVMPPGEMEGPGGVEVMNLPPPPDVQK